MSESVTLSTQKPPTAEIAFDHHTCPSCGFDTPDSSRPEIQSHPDPSSYSLKQLKAMWHGFFKEKAFFPYFRCKRCGILYCKTYLTPNQLNQFYEQMPVNMVDVPAHVLQKTQEGYFRFLQKYSRLHGDYLEIGPDVGLFTHFAVQEGIFDHFWLFEPNTSVQDKLKKQLESKHYQIFTEFLDVKKLPDHGIAVVVMVHVLDHLTDPKSLLIQLREKLTPDAKLLLVTHDESSLLAKITGRRWPPYCLQHPLLYNPETIQTLLECSGFRVMAVRKSVNYYPITYLAKHLLWVTGLKITPLPNWESPALPLKLGNIMTIAQVV